jgi:hypothetical protein
MNPPRKAKITPNTDFVVATNPGKMSHPMMVVSTSLILPVMEVASGELWMVHSIVAYVIIKPIALQMAKLIRKLGSYRCLKAASRSSSPVITAKPNAMGAATLALQYTIAKVVNLVS